MTKKIKIKINSDTTKWWWRGGETGASYIAGSDVKWYLLWKTAGQFLQKLKLQLPYNTAKVLPGIYPREMKIHSHENIYMNVYSSFTHNNQKLEKPRGPSMGE